MATQAAVSDCWDTLPLRPMLDELGLRGRVFMPVAMLSGRRFGKTHQTMHAALYLGPPVNEDEPIADTSGYARAGDRLLSCLRADADAAERAAATDHPPMQVALFNKDGKEPVRDPSYRRLLARFRPDANRKAHVNVKTVEFPTATCDWGVIDEAVVYDEYGDVVFSFPITLPTRITSGCIVSFSPGDLLVDSIAWHVAEAERERAEPGIEHGQTANVESSWLRPNSIASMYKEKYGDYLSQIELNGLPGSPADRARVECETAALGAQREHKLMTSVEYRQSYEAACGVLTPSPGDAGRAAEKYKFPVTAQFEHGHTAIPAGFMASLTKPDPIRLSSMSEELKHTLQVERSSDPVPAPVPAPPAKAPEPACDLDAIRAHNLKVMMGE